MRLSVNECRPVLMRHSTIIVEVIFKMLLLSPPSVCVACPFRFQYRLQRGTACFLLLYNEPLCMTKESGKGTCPRQPEPDSELSRLAGLMDDTLGLSVQETNGTGDVSSVAPGPHGVDVCIGEVDYSAFFKTQFYPARR